MLVGKPKEEALSTAHGVPTAPPPNQSSAWKADPAVKAAHVGSLPHFVGNSEEKRSVCALTSLCTAGTASASLPHGGFVGIIIIIIFIIIIISWVFGMLEWWENLTQPWVMGTVGMGCSSPVSRGFSACCGDVWNYKLCSCVAVATPRLV